MFLWYVKKLKTDFDFFPDEGARMDRRSLRSAIAHTENQNKYVRKRGNNK